MSDTKMSAKLILRMHCLLLQVSGNVKRGVYDLQLNIEGTPESERSSPLEIEYKKLQRHSWSGFLIRASLAQVDGGSNESLVVEARTHAPCSRWWFERQD
jgi:hypothetical protein